MFGHLSLSNPGAFSSSFLVDVKSRSLVRHIESECLPRNGKVFVSHAEKSSKGQNGIRNAACLNVKHNIFDFS